MNWDYTSSGYYYVTLCTKDRWPFFGEIVGGQMILSPIGKIVDEEWRRTPSVRSNVSLDEWVIMPNHLHGIIVIEEKSIIVETPRRGVSTTSYSCMIIECLNNRHHLKITGR